MWEDHLGQLYCAGRTQQDGTRLRRPTDPQHHSGQILHPRSQEIDRIRDQPGEHHPMPTQQMACFSLAVRISLDPGIFSMQLPSSVERTETGPQGWRYCSIQKRTVLKTSTLRGENHQPTQEEEG